MPWATLEGQDTDKVIENGRWVPSIDVLAVGTRVAADSLITNLNEARSYRVFTTIRPFKWYVFGFGGSWAVDQLQETLIDIAEMGEEKTLAGGFMPANSLIGTQKQAHPGWMPLQDGAYEINGFHKAWAWAELDTPGQSMGLRFWIDRDKSAKFLCPYIVEPGRQLRFIVSNRCEEDFPDIRVTVMGVRWLPWDAERVDD